MKRDELNNEPRYSPAKAAVVALVRPVMAVRRADHLGLSWAWAVHVVGAGLVVVVLMALSVMNNIRGDITAVSVARSMSDLQQHVMRLSGEVMAWAALATMVVFYEALVVFTAAVVMSWCARDEKIRKSYTRSLRRLFLLTPHAATVIAVTGMTVIGLDQMPWPYAQMFSYGEMAKMLVFATASLWSLWVVLASVGCRNDPPMSRWPVRCMGCGYQLVGLSRDKDCPECGRGIAGSFDPDRRPGIGSPGWLYGWIRVTYAAVRRPTVLGQQMHVLSPDTGHRRCLALTLVMLMLGSLVGFALLYVVVHYVDEWSHGIGAFGWREFLNVVLVGGGRIGLAAIGTVTSAALFGAGLIGGIEGWRHGRNLMPAAIRAACYQSGFMVLWSAVCWCNLTLLVVLMVLEIPYQYAARYNVALEEWILLWQFGVIGLGFVIYLFLIGRATHAARFANW